MGLRWHFVNLCLLQLLSQVSSQLTNNTTKQCATEVDIHNFTLSATSSYQDSVGAHHGRLDNEGGGGAWCPSPPITQDQDGAKEFLELDLGQQTYLLTSLVTQGRYAGGLGQEFAQHLRLQFWRPGLDGYVLYVNSRGQHIFEANRDTYNKVEISLQPPILATRLRVMPYSYHQRTVCMRVGLTGCQFSGQVSADQQQERPEVGGGSSPETPANRAVETGKGDKDGSRPKPTTGQAETKTAKPVGKPPIGVASTEEPKEKVDEELDRRRFRAAAAGGNGLERGYLGAAVGVLVTVIIILVIVILFILYKNFSLSKLGGAGGGTGLLGDSSPPQLYYEYEIKEGEHQLQPVSMGGQEPPEYRTGYYRWFGGTSPTMGSGRRLGSADTRSLVAAGQHSPPTSDDNCTDSSGDYGSSPLIRPASRHTGFSPLIRSVGRPQTAHGIIGSSLEHDGRPPSHGKLVELRAFYTQERLSQPASAYMMSRSLCPSTADAGSDHGPMVNLLFGVETPVAGSAQDAAKARGPGSRQHRKKMKAQSVYEIHDFDMRNSNATRGQNV